VHHSGDAPALGEVLGALLGAELEQLPGDELGLLLWGAAGLHWEMHWERCLATHWARRSERRQVQHLARRWDGAGEAPTLGDELGFAGANEGVHSERPGAELGPCSGSS
jgi:hypothetical protein